MAVLVVAGCAPGGQAGEAESAVERHVRGLEGYDAGDVSCTPSPRLGAQRVDLTICAVRRDDGRCDWFQVEFLSGDRTRVTLRDRDAGCVLPD